MSVLLWLAVIEVLGVIAFPIAFVTLRPLRDRGYSVAKPLGLLLMAYPAWLAGSWGAVPVGRAVIVVVVAGMAAASGYLAWRRRREIQRFLKQEWRLLAAMETVFLVLFLAWAAFRAYDPLINHTEQLMDFALLNTAARASSYPPEDPWLRGFAVNYYYFGYLCMGLLTRLTGVSSAVTYNLSLALVPAMAGVGVLGLVVSLVSRAGATLRTAFALGLLGVALLGLLANGEAALELVRARGFGSTGFWEGVGIKGLQEPAAVTSWFPRETWWWWRATRVIDTVVEGQSLDYTIHEFPLFSFFLGDLHPHVMSIPFLLLLLALLFSAVSGVGRAAGLGWLRRCWPALLLTGLVLGALGAVNTWDAPTFAGLSLGLLALKGYHDVRRRAEGRALVWTGLAALAVVGLAGLLYLPFYLGLQLPDSSIAPVRGPVTQLGHFAIVWAVFIVLLAPFLISQLRSVDRPFSAPCAMASCCHRPHALRRLGWGSPLRGPGCRRRVALGASVPWAACTGSAGLPDPTERGVSFRRTAPVHAVPAGLCWASGHGARALLRAGRVRLQAEHGVQALLSGVGRSGGGRAGGAVLRRPWLPAGRRRAQ